MKAAVAKSIIFTTFINDANIAMSGCFFIGNNAINLTHFKRRLVSLVIDADGKWLCHVLFMQVVPALSHIHGKYHKQSHSNFGRREMPKKRFNSRPIKECRTERQRQRACGCFNPRSHIGSDHSTTRQITRFNGFNPRPHVGSDPPSFVSMSIDLRFQSTPPCRERHGIKVDGRTLRKVSIHAPM